MLMNNSQNVEEKKDRYFNKFRYGCLISIVVPLYNEGESLEPLAEITEQALSEIAGNSWEVIFVDDGSTDSSFDILCRLHERNPKFKCIKFRRNYGKSAALAAGFAEVRGRYVGTMDADLQDDPSEIPNLLSH